jgi:predicted RNA-binding protein YlqC (UPF0109 family)
MDDLRKRAAADRSKINLHEPWEVDHWTKELGVSKDELQKVIAKVGNSAAAVRKELGRR